MSFKNLNKENTIPFLESSINDSLASLQSKFIDFLKIFDDIKEYARSLSTIQPKQFKRRKEIMYNLIYFIVN